MAAALLALLLLSFASVQSIVMRAVMASSGDVSPMCGDAPLTGSAAAMPMSGREMKPSATGDHDHRMPRGRKASCPYCAAAAHAPVVVHSTPLRHATGFVFATFQFLASHGPRGPPTCEPRARAPPVPPLTA